MTCHEAGHPQPPACNIMMACAPCSLFLESCMGSNITEAVSSACERPRASACALLAAFWSGGVPGLCHDNPQACISRFGFKWPISPRGRSTLKALYTHLCPNGPAAARDHHDVCALTVCALQREVDGCMPWRRVLGVICRGHCVCEAVQ